jgi:branched-chain amino acid transport system permease protein
MESLLFQAILIGISTGLVYGLVAIGLLIVYTVGHVVNFAHGDIITIGMYLGLIAVANLHAPYALAVIVVPLLGFAIGVLAERIGYRPFIKPSGGSGHDGLLMIFVSTLALSFAIEGALSLLVSTDGSASPSVTSLTSYQVGPFLINDSEILVSGVSLVLAVALDTGVRRTQAGRAMRAVAQNRDAASLLGINPRRLSTIGWGISGLLAAMAGVLLGPGSLVTPVTGTTYLFIAFAAAVLGGFGSIRGAIAGGVLIGIAQAMFSAFVSTTWASLVAFGLLILVLLVRPQGLFGRFVERV